MLSLTDKCRNNVAILDNFDTNGVFIFSFKKVAFVDRVFTLMLVYREQSMQMREFSRIMQSLEATYSIDVIAADFNYDLLKASEN